MAIKKMNLACKVVKKKPVAQMELEDKKDKMELEDKEDKVESGVKENKAKLVIKKVQERQ